MASRATPSMVRSESISMPLVALSSTAPGGKCGFRSTKVWRNPWEGTAIRTTPAPSRATGNSWVKVIREDSRIPGRKVWLIRSRRRASQTSGSLTHRRTSLPFSARSCARVVPQLPAPITAMDRRSGDSKIGLGLGFAVITFLRHLGQAHHPFLGLQIHEFDSLGDPADQRHPFGDHAQDLATVGD